MGRNVGPLLSPVKQKSTPLWHSYANVTYRRRNGSLCAWTSSLKFAPRPTGAGEMFQLLRDGQPRTRSDLATLTGQARSTIAARVDLLLVLRVRRARRRGQLDRRPPARDLRVQPRRPRRAGRRPRRHPRPPRPDRPGRHRAGRAPRAHRDRRGPRPRARPRRRARPRAARAPPAARVSDLVSVGVGPARTRRALDRPAHQPADHARLGRRRRARAPRPASCASPCSSTTTSTSWPSASTRRSGPTSTTCCSSRSRPGIGAGIISDGQIRRGAQGAAGDLGHIAVPGGLDLPCRCGNTGCLEAVASGPGHRRTPCAERRRTQRRRRRARARRRPRRQPRGPRRPAGTSARCSPRA